MQVLVSQLPHSFAAATEDDAADFFVLAKDSLLLAGKWTGLFAEQTNIQILLTDAHQHHVHRQARTGDTILINQGAAQLELCITSIVYDDYPDEDRESISVHTMLMHTGASAIFTVSRTGLILAATAETTDEMVAALPWNEWQESILDFSDVI
ncbi:hypothetical protein ACTHGU_04680 [Chitinophagaceae bacterium MMS25-I14]